MGKWGGCPKVGGIQVWSWFLGKKSIFWVKFVEIGYKTSKKAYKTAFQNKFPWFIEIYDLKNFPAKRRKIFKVGGNVEKILFWGGMAKWGGMTQSGGGSDEVGHYEICIWFEYVGNGKGPSNFMNTWFIGFHTFLVIANNQNIILYMQYILYTIILAINIEINFVYSFSLC